MKKYGAVFELAVGNTKVFFIDGKKKILVDTGLKALPQVVIDFFEKSGMRMGDEKEKELLRNGAYTLIKNFLSERGAKPDLIICTHCHLDHVGNLLKLKDFYRIPVALHSFDIPVVEGKEKLPIPPFIPKNLLEFFEFEPCSVDQPLEDGTLIDGDLQVIHLPGHTKGNIALLYQEDILMPGDSISGRNDLNPEIAPHELNPPSPLASLDHRQAFESLKKLLDYNFRVILPSHGNSIEKDGKEKLLKLLEGDNN